MNDLQRLVKGMETLALSLADVNRAWTNEERRAYEQAMAAAKRMGWKE